ncbi:DEAD/DEAH box helicase [Paraferrimonas sp. SM1919]|uniref:DEAD/DEAH box helicase n=1 Tax=Paraferrimonas sp. SM1919 TaxID=2662263 RepID=UPI0013D44769|nr:DEAD/DEAH box helicase [Paraferrimonas sp. SM1919]
MSFASLALSPPILQAVNEQGYNEPSPIQAKAIPAILTGNDVMAAAQTGTGKTAGFTLPILELLSRGKRARSKQVRTLVLTPTRELAAQVAENVEKYATHLPLRSNVVFGGVSINPQIQKLSRGSDVLVATPGRLLDLHQQGCIRFDDLEILVLDEADRMLDMGFIHDIKRILKLLPAKRQNLLFSATFSNEIRALAKGLVNNPVEVSVASPNTTAKTIEQWVYPAERSKRAALLVHLVKDNDWQQVLVFTKTKHGANRLAKQLDDKGITSAAIHGNKSQGARTRALENFKTGQIKVLVATDIAARGIDISSLPQVVNFDLPEVAEDYVHRIGRTGRAGIDGHAISLVTNEDFKLLAAIERLTAQVIQRKMIEGFTPINPLPESSLDSRGQKAPNKPKKTASRNSRSKPRPNKNNGSDDSKSDSRPKRRRVNPNPKSRTARKPQG